MFFAIMGRHVFPLPRPHSGVSMSLAMGVRCRYNRVVSPKNSMRKATEPLARTPCQQTATIFAPLPVSRLLCSRAPNGDPCVASPSLCARWFQTTINTNPQTPTGGPTVTPRTRSRRSLCFGGGSRRRGSSCRPRPTGRPAAASSLRIFDRWEESAGGSG